MSYLLRITSTFNWTTFGLIFDEDKTEMLGSVCSAEERIAALLRSYCRWRICWTDFPNKLLSGFFTKRSIQVPYTRRRNFFFVCVCGQSLELVTFSLIFLAPRPSEDSKILLGICPPCKVASKTLTRFVANLPGIIRAHPNWTCYVKFAGFSSPASAALLHDEQTSYNRANHLG